MHYLYRRRRFNAQGRMEDGRHRGRRGSAAGHVHPSGENVSNHCVFMMSLLSPTIVIYILLRHCITFRNSNLKGSALRNQQVMMIRRARFITVTSKMHPHVDF